MLCTLVYYVCIVFSRISIKLATFNIVVGRVSFSLIAADACGFKELFNLSKSHLLFKKFFKWRE